MLFCCLPFIQSFLLLLCPHHSLHCLGMLAAQLFQLPGDMMQSLRILGILYLHTFQQGG